MSDDSFELLKVSGGLYDTADPIMGIRTWLAHHPGEQPWLPIAAEQKTALELRDITDPEAEALAFLAINGLFAAHRDDGNTAYCSLFVEADGMLSLTSDWPPKEGGSEPADDFGVGSYPGRFAAYHYQYRTLNNGFWKAEHEVEMACDTVAEAVIRSVCKVIEAYPDHARQMVVWRHKPALERYEAQKEIRRRGQARFGLIVPARPAGWRLYMRLVATPVVL